MTPHEDDVLLVLLAQSGDIAAFEKLLRRLNTSDEKNSAVEPEEERFVRTALAQVEKAERFSRIRQIALSVIVIPAVYFLINSTPTEPGKLLIVMMVVGLMLAVCTAKIQALINKNTLAILRAVGDINRK